MLIFKGSDAAVPAVVVGHPEHLPNHGTDK